MLPMYTVDLSVPPAHGPALDAAVQGWLTALGLSAAPGQAGWSPAPGGRQRWMSLGEGADRRVEWTQEEGGLAVRSVRVWRTREATGERLVVHVDEAPGAPVLPARGSLRALGLGLRAAVLLAEDDNPLGQIHQPSVEEAARLAAFLYGARRLPAVLTREGALAARLVEEMGHTAHVFLLAPAVAEAFNQGVSGYHMVKTAAVVQVFAPCAGEGVEQKRLILGAGPAGQETLLGHVLRHCMRWLCARRQPPAAEARLDEAVLRQAVEAHTRETDAAILALRRRLEAMGAQAARAAAEVRAPTEQREDFDAFVEEFSALETALEEERGRNEALHRALGRAEAQVLALQAQIQQRATPPSEPPAPARAAPWDFDALEEGALGALVVTPSARATWAQRGHPHAEALWAALVKLAEAACVDHEQRGRIGGSLPQWLKARLSKECPNDDQGLVDRGLDTFEFQGRTHSRVPHVKVKDHCPFPEVARIYFALDPAEHRFIVDHVGGKLYNPL